MLDGSQLEYGRPRIDYSTKIKMTVIGGRALVSTGICMQSAVDTLGTPAKQTEQTLLFSLYRTDGGATVSKTLNLVIMILMAGLAIVEGYNLAQHGANPRNVLFCLLFAAFAVRRYMIHQKLAG
jgi:hypothetical protein